MASARRRLLSFVTSQQEIKYLVQQCARFACDPTKPRPARTSRRALLGRGAALVARDDEAGRVFMLARPTTRSAVPGAPLACAAHARRHVDCSRLLHRRSPATRALQATAADVLAKGPRTPVERRRAAKQGDPKPGLICGAPRGRGAMVSTLTPFDPREANDHHRSPWIARHLTW